MNSIMQHTNGEAPKQNLVLAENKSLEHQAKNIASTTSREVGEFELWREPKVGEYTGLGRTRRWQLEKKGAFPRRVKISERAVGWYAREIIEFARSRPRVEASVP